MPDNSQATDVANVGGTSLDMHTMSQVERMFSQIMQAASDPSVDSSKMVALADLQMRMMLHQREEQFAKDKVAAIMAMPTILKSGAIKGRDGQVQSRYAKLEDIQRICDPILASHNLTISWELGGTADRVTVCPILIHRNGHQEKGAAFPLPIDTTGSKNSTQGSVSAASYGKRATYVAACNIRVDGVDDDGQSAGGPQRPPGREYRPDQLELLSRGDTASRAGMDTYTEWYKALPAADRGWLVNEGKHDEFKRNAENGR